MTLSNLKIQPERKTAREGNDETLGHKIAKAAGFVYRMIGQGLDKRVYKQCLIAELENSGLSVETDATVSIHFREKTINPAFYIDIMVEDSVMIFVKSEAQSEMDKHVIRTYMRQSKKSEAFMINFGVADFKDAITHARVKTGSIHANKNISSSVN